MAIDAAKVHLNIKAIGLDFVQDMVDYGNVKVCDQNLKERVNLKWGDATNIEYDDNTFDRIIISHCLEHILSPENFIFEMMRTLKKGGVLSISLPTDPGFAWRVGRLFVGLFKINKTFKISYSEFEVEKPIISGFFSRIIWYTLSLSILKVGQSNAPTPKPFSLM